jgi:hypothetical protein
MDLLAIAARGKGLRTAGPDCYFACPLRSRSESFARKESKGQSREAEDIGEQTGEEST